MRNNGIFLIKCDNAIANPYIPSVGVIKGRKHSYLIKEISKLTLY